MDGLTELSVLEAPLIRADCSGADHRLSLPQVLAALVRDEIDGFRALRWHQAPAWHMFLAQTAALALHRAGRSEPPDSTDVWTSALRSLTADFPDHEPWRLVVDDGSKPAFLQAPVPGDVQLKNEVATPDGLDMLITSKNHDVKQAIGQSAAEDDWIFALVSGQTGDGFNGRGNYGIARMNGGSSSRVLLGLAPMAQADAQALAPRWGQRFRRDVRQMLKRRQELLERFPLGYRDEGGLALVWTAPWPEGEQLSLDQLDIWFVEICRRIRLRRQGGRLAARVGNSDKARIDAKANAGVLGDPWAPVNRSEAKSLTLSAGDFDYRRLSNLLAHDDWELPLLATLGEGEADGDANWALIAQAFARGNSRTDGFRERIVPVAGRVARGFGRRRAELHQISRQQIEEIAKLDAILREAIALAAAGGDREKVKDRQLEMTRTWRLRLQIEADRRFFEALWERFDAQLRGDAAGETAAREVFVMALIAVARALLREALADLPCASIRRPRAEARARASFEGRLRSSKVGFPEYFLHEREEAAHDA